ncbi:MAG: DMT family transporter [Sulfitobacter pontiacus]|uniref:DMT family transporter n=1 Tax=Sulfitobacter pontiacus TaxID=60137 RepID=UPI0032642331
MSVPRKSLIGVFWAATAIVVWSGSLVMLRLGVTTSLNAYDLTMLRFGVAAIVLAPVIVTRGLGRPGLPMWGACAMVIAFGAPYIVLLSFAIKTAPVAAAGALNPGMMAIASVPIGALIFADKVGVIRTIGLLITTVGIIVFTWAGGSLTLGHVILVGTGLMWAVYAVIVRYFAVPALHATAIVAVGSALMFAPLYAVVLPKNILAAPFIDIVTQAVFQGIFVSVAAVYAFNRSAECLGPTTGAVLPALIPVVTMGLGVIGLGETVSLGAFVSALMVTAGLTLILVGRPMFGWCRVRFLRVGRTS